MLKLVMLTESTDLPRFARVERVEYDLACPHCNSVMGEKDFSFKSLGPERLGVWSHNCPDGETREFRWSEEQESQYAAFNSFFSR